MDVAGPARTSPDSAEAPLGGIRRVAHRSLVEVVLAEIRRSLLDRTLVPGAPFSITDLSDRLGVSHVPVREALRRMEAEGLVELRPGRSARVAPLTKTDMTEIFHLRALLEADAMARAAPLYTDADLEAIEAAWEGLLSPPPVDLEDIFHRHQAFHDLLVRRSAGPWNRRLVDILHRAGDRYIALLILGHVAEAPANLQEQHRDLVDAAKTRSPERARAAVQEHIETAADLIAALLDETEGRTTTGN